MYLLHVGSKFWTISLKFLLTKDPVVVPLKCDDLLKGHDHQHEISVISTAIL